MVPALYETTVRHVRTSPVRNAFSYPGHCWLVDLDELPVLPAGLRRLAEFRPADHLGDASRSIRENVDAELAERGVDLHGGRVLMLAHPRVLGHVFNPISVFWCHDAAGQLVCVLAEVHNTYGGRHVYLLHPDERGRARTEKQFYVSPFNPVDGHYTMSLPVPGDRLDLVVTLLRPGAAPFVATLRGTRRPATTGSVVRTSLRRPLHTRAVSARIRLQGIRLVLRRLPVQPRPTHPQENA